MGSSESSIPMDDSQGEASNQASITRNQVEFVQDPEDPWWWEIENQNLLLNVVSDELDSGPSTSADALARNVRGDSERIMIRNKLSSEASRPSDREEGECASASTVLEKSARIESEINASVQKEQTLEQFKEELKAKRLARQTAVNELREEIQSLRRQLADERDVTRRLRSDRSAEKDKEQTPSDLEEHRKKLLEESDRVLAQQIFDDDVVAGSSNPKVHLAEAQLALQLANADNLSLTTELGVTRKQVTSLKEVVACCKQMIAMKEEQVVQLKGKLEEIEESLAERELKLMSDKLRQEYDRQLANMRTLRQLYEERARVSAAERDNLQRQISMKKDEVEVEKEKTKSVEERTKVLEKDLENTNQQLLALKEQCTEYKFENKTLKEEMGAVNKFFSQMLMGFNGTNNLDIDRLTSMLEENRTLLNDMATKEANSDGATLPKLLFELVQQAAVANHQHHNLYLETESESNLDHRTNQPDDEEHENIPEITRYRTTSPTTTSSTTLHHLSQPTTNVCGEPSIDGISCDKSTPSTMEQTTTFGGIATTNTSTATDTSDGPCTTRTQSTDNLPNQHNDKGHEEKAETKDENLDHEQSPKVTAKVASAEEIIGNLPKVWKVLMELLSHHKIERVQFRENGQSEDCFKSVETPNGPKAELSVSKTYIKLKDLILEKKSLVKETNRLKTLNCHLEFRLNEQEKRLSAVSLELQKTWHLVNKMQRQHRQLHTQEQILRYQLQQKRRLLCELKDELEYCRRKWAAARAKNDESQLQCDDLRREFAKRKLQDAHHSAESGYSDGPGSDEDDPTAAPKDVTTSRKWEDMFEVKTTIKRMQSTSPGRSTYEQGDDELRWSSAPPAVNCPIDDSLLLPDDDQPSTSNGNRKGPRMSRSKVRGSKEDDDEAEVDESEDGAQSDRATRIQRLEEQCKSLIAAVIETSGNRERLEVQLCRFQDEITPPQYPMPLDEYISNKTLDSMKRANSAPEISKSDEDCLTPRELEYTRRRSERLGRLEEESRQLMSRIKRTSARGNSLRSSLERIHAKHTISREGSFESNTEEVAALETVTQAVDEQTGLTAAEEEYTSKRAERLKRLEEESKALLSKLSKNSERGNAFNSKLDALHEKYGSEEREPCTSKSIDDRLKNVAEISVNREERLRILEEEGRQLINKLTNTANRGAQMIDRLKDREETKSLKASLEHPPDTEALASSIPPTPKNVASSSIVSEEITERVVITRTPSQIALSQETTDTHSEPRFSQPIEKPAVVLPHTSTKLCAASGRKRVSSTSNAESTNETLEQMVRRLRNLPFPGDNETPDNPKA